MNMGTLTYVVGDATNPIGDGRKVIIHCCNDIGGWGSGFVLAISKKWPQPEKEYRKWAATDGGLKLGEVHAVDVGSGITVINMIGQQGVGWENGRAPIRYGAIGMCLERVGYHAKKYGYTVHAPRFGAGLAGGDWLMIEKLIQTILLPYGVNVVVYDFPTAEDQADLIAKRMNADLF